MESKIIDYLFGSKKIHVVGYRLANYAEYEQEFVFHKNYSQENIKRVLSKFDCYIRKIYTTRSKKFNRHEPNTYTSFPERCIKHYD